MWFLSILSLCLCKRGNLIREYKNSNSRKDTDSLKQKTDSSKKAAELSILFAYSKCPSRENQSFVAFVGRG